jgi:hypothetical protein
MFSKKEFVRVYISDIILVGVIYGIDINKNFSSSPPPYMFTVKNPGE